ncbi:hypothetical protein Taro_053166 [Colocasia esculenta]|uniref:Uncharacterized protein n=1 Tax=Colocasia esculenta TaxID=4460 RepID=A0A843XK64_COLES|nr:hypothetical protein [Colocasia esculenta]
MCCMAEVGAQVGEILWQFRRTGKPRLTSIDVSANPMHTSTHVDVNLSRRQGTEKELKRPPTFQEVFDKTHKKKGTDQYISDRAREVTESHSQQMIEKYAGEEEQPHLDPKVWVAASGAPKKGHVYCFENSMDTSRQGVIWHLEFRITGD